MTDTMSGPAKRLIALRHYLEGKGFFRALRALDFASRYHVGYRKDGVTPELDHQVSLCLHARTLPLPEDGLEHILIVILLHDTVEDFYERAKIAATLPIVTVGLIEGLFGAAVARDVELLSKVVEGVKKDEEAYFSGLVDSWVSCLVKLLDRIHNLSTMVGGMNFEKRLNYVEEAKTRILPLAKIGARAFPEHGRVFENLKHTMRLLIASHDNLAAVARGEAL